MKNLLPVILLPLLLCGCGVSQHGIRGYATVTDTDGKSRSVLVGAINADIPGAKLVQVGDVHIDIDPNVAYTKTQYNSAGQVVATATLPGGVYVSEVTMAQGEADSKRTTAGGNTALKALFGFALPGLGSDAFGWLSSWLAP